MAYEDIYHYDVEIFPTFFSVTFKRNMTDEILQFSIGCGVNELGELKQFLLEPMLLVGYNNTHYDAPVLRYLEGQFYTAKLNKALFALSKRLISDKNRSDQDLMSLRYPREIPYAWDSLDLMTLMALDRYGVSLKQTAIILKYHTIQDLPYAYDYKITESEVSEVLKYNINDVEVTEALYHHLEEERKLRDEIGRMYGVDIRSASRSKMGNVLLENHYVNELGYDLKELKQRRTKRSSVKLSECIANNISFTSPVFKRVLEKLNNTTAYATRKFRFEPIEIHYKGTTYKVASGGLHSNEKGVRFDSDDKKTIVTCDIASMYPACMINNKIAPEHLDRDEFINVLKTLTQERVKAKKTHKLKAEALKITINGIYGKTNSEHFWLEDAKAMLNVTISGQLYLLMLVEMLEEKGIHCISANTDGIECYVYKKDERVYYEVCKKWEDLTNFTLEFNEYLFYVKRDVNSYTAFSRGKEWFSSDWENDKEEYSKPKNKGVFVEELSLVRGYKYPIVAKALNLFFHKNIPIEKTIYGCQDIFDFCVSRKSKSTFNILLIDANGEETTLQKTNRFYISPTGQRLITREKTTGHETGVFVGYGVKTLNRYDSRIPFSEYDVNKMWYINEAMRIILPTEAKQDDMFSSVADYGEKTNLFPSIVLPTKEEVAPVKEKDIREAHSTRNTFAVDKKFLLVTSVNTNFSPRLNTYSLGTGAVGVIKINKKVFKSEPVRVGDVIFVHKFSTTRKQMPDGTKNEKGEPNFMYVDGMDYWADNYEIITEFKAFKREVIK